MSRTVAHSLGYAAILFELRTWTALFLTGLVYVGLAFGLMAVQESE